MTIEGNHGQDREARGPAESHDEGMSRLPPPPPGRSTPPSTAETGSQASATTPSWLLSGLVGALLGAGLVGGLWYMNAGSADARLDELGEFTCEALDGTNLLGAASIIGVAVDRAEELGFSGPELGDRLQAHCPFLYDEIQRRAGDL